MAALTTCVMGWDHPRVCGEKHTQGRKSGKPAGSPPRMRGKDTPVNTNRCGVGITPAYAGKSIQAISQTPSGRDHPRVCGEKLYWLVNQLKQAGSPPRMRGKVSVGRLPQCCTGITPAYAGKRPRYLGLERRVRDHPRVCGEKAAASVPQVEGSGSPPRMRGKADTTT